MSDDFPEFIYSKIMEGAKRYDETKAESKFWNQRSCKF